MTFPRPELAKRTEQYAIECTEKMFRKLEKAGWRFEAREWEKG